MKVLVFNSLYPPLTLGGAERVVRDAVESLRADGHEVRVLSSSGRVGWPTQSPSDANEWATPSLNVYHFLRRPAGRWLRLLWHLGEAVNPVMRRWARREIRRFGPDLILIGNYWGLSSSLYSAANGYTVAAYLHDASLLCVTGHMRHPNGRQCRGDRFPCRMLLGHRRSQVRAATSILAPSEFLANVHQSAGLFVDARRHILRNSVAVSTSPAAFRGDDEALRMAYVGQLAEHKGLELLERIASSMPLGARLSVVGTGGPNGLRISGHGVNLCGELDEAGVRDVLRRCHVLLFPSICYENAPRVVLEAHSEGLGVIAFDMGGTPEMVEDGVDGILVKPVDEDGFMRAVHDLASDPRLTRRLQEGARRRSLDRSEARTIVDVLPSLVRPRQRTGHEVDGAG